MSVDHTRWVWQKTIGSGTVKMVLLALADHANEFHTCFPSLDTLVKETEFSISTVRRAIETLVDDLGLVAIERESSQHRSTLYRLVVDSEFIPTTERNIREWKRRSGCSQGTGSLTLDRDQGAQCEPQTVHSERQTVHSEHLTTTNHQEPLIPPNPLPGGESEPKAPKKGKRMSNDRAYTSDYGDFWEVFPRKINKPGAFKAWNAALKRGVTQAQIFNALERYVHEVKDTDPKWIKHPATWLNSDPWDNETPTSKPISAQINPTPKQTTLFGGAR